VVGMGGSQPDDIHISSWGYTDEEGALHIREGATFRLWSVTNDTGRIGMLLLPVDQDTHTVYLTALRAFGDDSRAD
jgi:hypothetical protein